MPSSRVPAVTVNVLKLQISLQFSLKACCSNVLLGRKLLSSHPKLGWVRSCESSQITMLQSHISIYLLDILLPKEGTSQFLPILKIQNVSANYLPQPFIYTKDKSSPQIPLEECQYVLGISCTFCLMSSLEGKVMFNCHGNTLNSSPIYSYTNYKDTVHRLQDCFLFIFFLILTFGFHCTFLFLLITNSESFLQRLV